MSQIADERVANVSDYLRVGDVVRVRVLDIDESNGRIRLSIRACLQDQKNAEQEAQAPQEELEAQAQAQAEAPAAEPAPADEGPYAHSPRGRDE